ncbi:hypothetical protein NL676_029277 [Syzygium grande]|nr:hypothetical protein NL676_029277 [Syzygium grande]
MTCNKPAQGESIGTGLLLLPEDYRCNANLKLRPTILIHIKFTVIIILKQNKTKLLGTVKGSDGAAPSLLVSARRVVGYNKGRAGPCLDLSQGLLALVHNGDEAPPSGEDRLALATMSGGMTDAHMARAKKPSFAHGNS